MQPTPITVAIQGDRASFHEIAAHRYYKTPIQLIYCQTFEEAFEKLLSGTADKAFVAVANSNHGDIDEVKQLMITNNVVPDGEYLLPIQQHLIGLDNTDLEKITTVISHPIALSQCSLYVKNQLSKAIVLDYYDTSAAIDYVKEKGDPSIAAIGSESAAELYGLKILRRSIQNDPNNATLFKSMVRFK